MTSNHYAINALAMYEGCPKTANYKLYIYTFSFLFDIPAGCKVSVKVE